ncbi:unnamed protein product [Lupinus luteus]|uniref:Uncharacterized protein n=1 Tax=Lupinus luteus TaxID=3873 RepID=A0AAV1VXP4_LUPLU
MAKQFRVPLQIWRHFMKGPASYDAFTEIGKASEARTSHEARVMAWVTFTKHSEHVPSLSPSPRKVCNGMGQFHLVALGRMCHGLAITYHFGRCNFQLYKLPLTVTWTSQYLYFYLTSHSTVNNYTVPFRGRRPYGYDPCLVKVMRSMTWERVPWDWPPTRRIWDNVSIEDFAPIRAIAHHRLGVEFLLETLQATMAKQFRVPLQMCRHFLKGSASYDAFSEIGNASETSMNLTRGTGHFHRALGTCAMAWVTFTLHSGRVPGNGSLSPSTRKVWNGLNIT